jgi:hypothetical protein
MNEGQNRLKAKHLDLLVFLKSDLMLKLSYCFNSVFQRTEVDTFGLSSKPNKISFILDVKMIQ